MLLNGNAVEHVTRMLNITSHSNLHDYLASLQSQRH